MQNTPHAEQPLGKPTSGDFMVQLSRLLNDYAPSRQRFEAAGTVPFFVFFYLCSTISVDFIVIHQVPQALFGLWHAIVLVTAALFMWQIHQDQTQKSLLRSFLKAPPIFGLMLAAAWFLPILVFTKFISGEFSIAIFSIAFTVMAMGTLSLLLLPGAALSFSLLMVVMITLGVIEKSLANIGLTILSSLLFSVILISAIVAQHFNFFNQNKTEEDAKRQSQVIKLLLNDFENGTSDWLWETDPDNNLVYFSPRLANIFGKSQSELHGISFSSLFETDGATLFENKLALKSDIVEHHLQSIIQGEIHHWQISARVLADENDRFKGYRGVGRDISTQIEHHRQIENARVEAEKANVAKSQFLAVISHELRTPINAIVGFSEILNSSTADNISPSNQNEYLTTILESARHLQGLINDVLDATRIERGALQLEDQENDAAELVETAIKICRDHAHKSNISIIAHVVDDVFLNGDLTRLKQVILNLLTNAIKFSPAGSVVNVNMQRGANNQLFISIRDAGIGISPEDAELVFEPFVQADQGANRKYGGMGLGLAIARKIARLHGGDVILRSGAGFGTEALLTLPAARIRWPNPANKAAASVAA